MCESHTISGGCAHSFERSGFKFDSGPSIFSGFTGPVANPLKQAGFVSLWFVCHAFLRLSVVVVAVVAVVFVLVVLLLVCSLLSLSLLFSGWLVAMIRCGDLLGLVSVSAPIVACESILIGTLDVSVPVPCVVVSVHLCICAFDVRLV